MKLKFTTYEINQTSGTMINPRPYYEITFISLFPNIKYKVLTKEVKHNPNKEYSLEKLLKIYDSQVI